MKLLLDILQGAGASAASGVRPFLPALLYGALASADLGVDFDGTSFAFLESPVWLLVLVLLLVAAVVLRARTEAGPGEAALTGLGIGLGAVLFAGTLDDRHDTWWWGLLAGAALAAFAGKATRDLLGRVRGRLDAGAAGTLFVYAEAFAVVLLGLSVLFPPLALLGLGLLAFLLAGGKRREGEKYAGLRILR